MEDTARRDDIRSRVEATQRALNDLHDRLHPSVQQMLRPAASALSDLTGLLAIDHGRTPAEEEWWLDRCEEWLQLAISQLQSAREQIDRYGGPDSARMPDKR